ncbi:hypothetical protein GCM10010990_04530 [Croceicoccus mobilis]|uniref:Uncharacterized protein n=2 Tax=Croceicoccus mobilis TaxID=1703339 RepID=A0A917DQ34_9SPHN|nr:hypothetical protein GCM10010990_04530 [Croceicoccus mobilis]
MMEKSSGQVEPFPKGMVVASIEKQLAHLRDMLLAELPFALDVAISFDGKLEIHVDVRRQEEAYLVETKLGSLPIGRFQHINRGSPPHHPFLHRVSAQFVRDADDDAPHVPGPDGSARA